MNEVLIIIILRLVSDELRQRKCTWFLRESVQVGFTPSVMEKRSPFALIAMTGAGPKIAGLISRLIDRAGCLKTA
jgi:hypothetical protein